MTRTLTGGVLALVSLVALGFLVYTLRHLDDLGIALVHGRVIVEALCVVGFAAGAAWLLTTGGAP